MLRRPVHGMRAWKGREARSCSMMRPRNEPSFEPYILSCAHVVGRVDRARRPLADQHLEEHEARDEARREGVDARLATSYRRGS